MCLANSAGVARRAVISHAVAFAPFSQNSNGSAEAGFDQAQLTHWKPSTLFCRSSTSGPLRGTPSRRRMLANDRADPQPPEGCL